MKQLDLNKLIFTVKVELGGVVQIFREKGVKYFARPLGISAGAAFAAYILIYVPSAGRLHQTEAQLLTFSASTKYSAHYQELKDRLQIYSSMIPQGQDNESWLLNAVRDAMKAEGISFTNISPVTSQDMSGYTTLSLSVEGNATYRQFALWIDRMEHSRYFLNIATFVLARDSASSDETGIHKFQLTVVSAVPKGGAP